MCNDLQHCFSSLRLADICLCTALLMSRHSVWIRLRSGLGCAPATLWFFSFSSLSVVDLLLAAVFLLLLICLLDRWPQICLYKEELWLQMLRSCGCKAMEISCPPPPYFTVSIWGLCWHVIYTAETDETRGFLLATLCIVMKFNRLRPVESDVAFVWAWNEFAVTSWKDCSTM